jgi:hypothetical protein
MHDLLGLELSGMCQADAQRRRRCARIDGTSADLRGPSATNVSPGITRG